MGINSQGLSVDPRLVPSGGELFLSLYGRCTPRNCQGGVTVHVRTSALAADSKNRKKVARNNYAESHWKP